MSGQGLASLKWDPEHLQLGLEAAGVALWSWNVDTNHFTMDQHGFELWGLPWATKISFEEMSARIHPADRDRVRAAFEATRSVKGPFEVDFRILLDDHVRWVSSRGQGADAGMRNRAMFGVFQDVTLRKQAEESNELLAGEMSHRVRNLLAIAMGLTDITSRSAGSKQDMAKELTQRLSALGRAHDLVRPVHQSEGKSVLLGDLIAVLLSPYDDQGAFAGRVRVAVNRMGVGEAATTTLALVIHELATNSLKHGALSNAEGMISVSSSDDGEMLRLIWAETGGPKTEAPPKGEGFGLKMLERSLTRQFGGTLCHDWQPAGLVATLSMRKDRLAV